MNNEEFREAIQKNEKLMEDVIINISRLVTEQGIPLMADARLCQEGVIREYQTLINKVCRAYEGDNICIDTSNPKCHSENES